MVSTDFLTIAGQKAYTVRWYDTMAAGGADLLFLAPSSWVIITESNVASHLTTQLDELRHNLARISTVHQITVNGHGESIKTMDTVLNLAEQLNALNADRRSILVAVGGGVIGDVVGFLASIYNRGIRYVQVPTTTIAQTDSAIGGKTAVNTNVGKNSIGTFHNPSAVIIGQDVLETLPMNHYKAGYAEILKYALIGDAPMLKSLEENKERWMAKDTDYIKSLTHYALRQKAKYVTQDFYDTDIRQLLNFGHTFGHALEKLSDYTLVHGDAVAIGMVMAFQYSVHLGVCDVDDAGWVIKHLHTMGLPTMATYDSTRLFDAMKSDKKNSNGDITLILARGLGTAYIHKVKDESHLKQWLDDQQQ